MYAFSFFLDRNIYGFHDHKFPIHQFDRFIGLIFDVFRLRSSNTNDMLLQLIELLNRLNEIPGENFAVQ